MILASGAPFHRSRDLTIHFLEVVQKYAQPINTGLDHDHEPAAVGERRTRPKNEANGCANSADRERTKRGSVRRKIKQARTMHALASHESLTKQQKL
eukprot:scaffold350_cov333-Pavlova_lutheri.AAC.11